MRVSYLRHEGWFSPAHVSEVSLNIIGVGATGSWIGLIAAKMGFQDFTVWDADKVEEHNLANQIYDIEDVGSLKVDAFERVLRRFNPNIKVSKHPYFFEKEHENELKGPLVLTVDTMKARAVICEAFSFNPDVEHVWETKLGFTHAEINSINNMNIDSINNFKSTLRDDSEVQEGPCNLRICTTLVTLVAGTTVHEICKKYVSSAKKEKWEYSPKIIFSNETTLDVYNV